MFPLVRQAFGRRSNQHFPEFSQKFPSFKDIAKFIEGSIILHGGAFWIRLKDSIASIWSFDISYIFTAVENYKTGYSVIFIVA